MFEARLRNAWGRAGPRRHPRREAGAFYVAITATSFEQTEPPWTSSDDTPILVTGPDMAAAGADVHASSAITPTAAAGALRTMRWPLRVFESPERNRHTESRN
jgi:hypothetical protein